MGNICDIFKKEIREETVSPIVFVATPSYIQNDISGSIPIGKPVNTNLYQPSDPIPIIGNNQNNLQQPGNYSIPNQPIIIYNQNPNSYYNNDGFATGFFGGILMGELLSDDCF